MGIRFDIRECRIHSSVHLPRALAGMGYVVTFTCKGHARKHSWYLAFLLRTFVQRADQVPIKIYKGLRKEVS